MKVKVCDECKLYWQRVGGQIEYRMSIFAPIKLEKCPYCKDPNKEFPEKAKDMSKVNKNKMTMSEYIKKYNLNNGVGQ